MLAECFSGMVPRWYKFQKKKRKTAAAERFCDYTGATIFTAQKMLQAQQFVSEVAEPVIAQPPDARLSSEGLVL